MESQSIALPTELMPPLSLYSHRLHIRNPGLPDRDRTCNPRLRRPVLYPIELRADSDELLPLSGSAWSGWRDSNPRHLAPKASALPDCATPREGGTIHIRRASVKIGRAHV